MTTQALLTLIAFSLLKGALFGALFAWLFPLLNRLIRRMGREPAPGAAGGSAVRLAAGLAVLSGSGFALLDLVGSVSEAADLPELLRWAVAALFAAAAWGTVLITSATPRTAEKSTG